jgi:hypothetical protein
MPRHRAEPQHRHRGWQPIDQVVQWHRTASGDSADRSGASSWCRATGEAAARGRRKLPQARPGASAISSTFAASSARPKVRGKPTAQPNFFHRKDASAVGERVIEGALQPGRHHGVAQEVFCIIPRTQPPDAQVDPYRSGLRSPTLRFNAHRRPLDIAYVSPTIWTLMVRVGVRQVPCLAIHSALSRWRNRDCGRTAGATAGTPKRRRGEWGRAGRPMSLAGRLPCAGAPR